MVKSKILQVSEWWQAVGPKTAVGHEDSQSQAGSHVAGDRQTDR